MTISTRIVKPSGSSYLKFLFGRWVSDNWYYFVVAVLPFVVLSFFFTILWYVTVMVVFLVIPMLLALVFFRYAFKEEAVFAVRKGSIAISGTKITKFFYNEEEVVVGSKSLGITEFCSIDDFDGGFRLMYKKAKYQFIPFYVADFYDFDAYIQAKLVIAKQIGINNII